MKNQMKVSDNGNVKRASAPQDAEESAIHVHAYQTKCGHEKSNYNNNKKNISNTRKSSTGIIEDNKVNKKNQMKVLDDRDVKRASASQDAEESTIHGHVYQTKCSKQDTETLLPKDIYGIYL